MMFGGKPLRGCVLLLEIAYLLKVLWYGWIGTLPAIAGLTLVTWGVISLHATRDRTRLVAARAGGLALLAFGISVLLLMYLGCCGVLGRPKLKAGGTSAAIAGHRNPGKLTLPGGKKKRAPR